MNYGAYIFIKYLYFFLFPYIFSVFFNVLDDPALSD